MGKPILPLPHQVETIRMVDELRAQGLSTVGAVAVIRARQAAKERAMARQQQAIPLEDYHRYHEIPAVVYKALATVCMWGVAVCVISGVLLAGYGIAYLIVQHAPKALGRLGF